MDTLKTDKGYLQKMVLLCDTGLCAVTIMLLCDLFRVSPGKPEDPRAPHTEAGSSPGSSDQWRKGLCPPPLLFHDH